MTLDYSRVVVCTPVAPLFAEPKVASAQISQYLAGRELEILEKRDDWFRVAGPDEYEGWMHRGYVAPASTNAGRGKPSDFRISLGCVTTNREGARRAMPLGAWLTAGEQVGSGDAIDASERLIRFPPEAKAIAQSAQLYFEGTSYLWGGITPWGADCSGLVQAVFSLHGIQLRRDAWMQAEQGRPGESDPRAAHTADLLFFSDRIDRHITHVAIALGGGRLVHLALGRGGYSTETLSDTTDPYVRKLLDRFVTARRVLTPQFADR